MLQSRESELKPRAAGAHLRLQFEDARSELEPAGGQVAGGDAAGGGGGALRAGPLAGGAGVAVHGGGAAGIPAPGGGGRARRSAAVAAPVLPPLPAGVKMFTAKTSEQ